VIYPDDIAQQIDDALAGVRGSIREQVLRLVGQLVDAVSEAREEGYEKGRSDEAELRTIEPYL
jgi:hypothetical protein